LAWFDKVKFDNKNEVAEIGLEIFSTSTFKTNLRHRVPACRRAACLPQAGFAAFPAKAG